MGRSRVLVLVSGAAITAVAALGAGSAAVASTAVAAGAPVTAAAVQVVPFSTGHILAAGKVSQPPTTAECETNFGIACYQPFQLQRAYHLAPLFSRGIEGKGETIVIVDAFGSRPSPPTGRPSTRRRACPTRPRSR